MAELKITPIVPVDDDDAPARRRKAPAAAKKAREPRERTASSRSVDNEPVIDPSEPEFDPKAVADEVKRRYGIEGGASLKVTEVKRSRSGVNSHKTGNSKR